MRDREIINTKKKKKIVHEQIKKKVLTKKQQDVLNKKVCQLKKQPDVHAANGVEYILKW